MRRMSLGAAQLQRLEDERRNVQVTHPAAVGDLVHLHEAVARRAPRLVGLRLLLQHAIEVGLALLELSAERHGERGRAQMTSGEKSGRPLRTGRSCPRSYTVPAALRPRACARVSQSHNRLRGFGRRRAVERHQRGRHARESGRCRRASGPSRPPRPRSGRGVRRWILRSDGRRRSLL